MPRPSTQDQRRRELLPKLTQAFASTGYAAATTAALAERCGVPENTLFRLWGGKKGMYLAALDHLYEATIEVWRAHLARTEGEGSPAERLLDHEGVHYGEHGLYRMVFAGLGELDDAEIRKAVRTMYRRFHAFVTEQIAQHRGDGASAAAKARSARLAWTVIGMATVAGIGRELRLITRKDQRHLFTDVGRGLLELAPTSRDPRKRDER